MASQTRAKRLREEPASSADFMFKARIIMDNDPFKELAPKGTDKRFRALFGCPSVVAFKLWKELLSNKLLPEGGTMTHLLWTLMFLKVYPSDEAMGLLTGGADAKTLRKWIDRFLDAIDLLLPSLVGQQILISRGPPLNSIGS